MPQFEKKRLSMCFVFLSLACWASEKKLQKPSPLVAAAEPAPSPVPPATMTEDPVVVQRRQRVVDSACKNPWSVGGYNPSAQFSAATYPHILKARNYAMSQYKDLYPFVYKSIPASVYNKEPWPQTFQIENLIKAELALAPSKIRGSVDVLLGDSLSYYFPVELYPQGRTLWNIGIPGNTTTAVQARLDQVKWSSVDRVFMLIGINDYVSQRFLGDGANESMASIAARVIDGALNRTKQIMETIYKNQPNAAIYVISLFPSRDKSSTTPKSHMHISNAGVLEHNKRLKELARSMGAGWVNSAQKLSEPSVFVLRNDFTNDGIHLSWTGNINYAASLQEGLMSICSSKQPVSYFSDTDKSPYSTEIVYAVQRNLVSGFPDGSFKPLDGVTREQAAVMSVNLVQSAMALPAPTTTATFKDVAPDRWSAKAIAMARQLGIVNGFPDGSFQPESPVSRSQLAVMMLGAVRMVRAALGLPEETTEMAGFEKSPLNTPQNNINGHWARVPILKMNTFCQSSQNDLLQTSLFNPDTAATREYTTAMMARASQCLVSGATPR